MKNWKLVFNQGVFTYLNNIIAVSLLTYTTCETKNKFCLFVLFYVIKQDISLSQRIKNQRIRKQHTF